MLILPRKGSNPKIKPKPWGPLSAVQSAVRWNADAMGLPHPAVHWGLIEQAGSKIHDIMSADTGTITNGTWAQGGVQFNGSTTAITIPTHPGMDGIIDFTALVRAQYDGGAIATSAGPFLMAQRNGGIHGQWFIDTYFGIPRLRMYNGGWGLDFKAATSTENDFDQNVGDIRNVSVVCYDSLTDGSIYINDRLAGTGSIGTGTALDKDISSSLGYDRRDNAKYWTGIIYQAIIWLYALTADQIATLHEQPYRLLYPVSRTLIFDLGAPGATSITPTSVSVLTSVDTPSVNLIRALGLENASVSTQVTALTLSLAVKQLTGLDVSSDSQVTTASIQAIRAILESDVSTPTEVTNLAMQVARACGLNDVSSQTQVATASMSVVRAILTGGVSSSTEVTNAAITATRLISAVQTAAATEVTPLTLDRVRHIAFDAVQSATEVGAVDINQGRAIAGADVSAATTVSEATISVLRQIAIDGVVSASQVTAVAVGTSGALGILDVSSQTQVAAVSMAVLRQFQEADVSAATEVGTAALQAIRAISFAEVSSASEVSAVATQAVRVLGITDLSALTAVENIALNVARMCGPLTVTVSSEVSDVFVSALRTIFTDAVSVSTEVGAASISVGAITVPSARLVVVAAENRVVVVPAENRVVVVAAENRIVEVT